MAFNGLKKALRPSKHGLKTPNSGFFNYLPDELNLNFSIEKEISIEEEFELIFGESDLSGQLNNIIFHFNNDLTTWRCL